MSDSPRASAEQEAMSLYDDMATKRAWGTKEDAIRYLATALRTTRQRAFEEAAEIAEHGTVAIKHGMTVADIKRDIATTLRRMAGEKES